MRVIHLSKKKAASTAAFTVSVVIGCVLSTAPIAQPAAHVKLAACHGNGVKQCPTTSTTTSSTTTTDTTTTTTDTTTSTTTTDTTTTSTTTEPTTTTTTTTPVAPQPVGPPGTWTPSFADEFDGTAMDTTKWDVLEGRVMNNVTTHASNVSVAGGLLHLQLNLDAAGAVGGAMIETGYTPGRYDFPVGSVIESRLAFPGTDTEDVWDWPAWWTSGPSWPSNGEFDIFEGLGGGATINYHWSGGTLQRVPTPSCCWHTAFHTYTLYRGATSAQVWWDGVLQADFPTSDLGGAEDVILNLGKSNSRAPHLGTEGEVQVDYVRAWTP